MTIAREAIASVIAVLRAEPAMAHELREVLGLGPAKAPADAVAFERVGAFAKRVAVSERTAWNLVAKGLPCVGSGRGRRVDVGRALNWMRTERDRVDDAVERQARASASRAARRATR